MAMLTPIGGPTSWAGSELAGRASWKFELPSDLVQRLLDQVEALEPLCQAGGLAAVAQRGVDDLRLDTTEVPARVFDNIRAELVDGSGVALLRGLPVEELTVEQSELLLWYIGVQLGQPIHQNPARDLVVRVVDAGKDWNDERVRAYETAASLNYHCDSSDIVGLLCIRPAQSGGVSTVVSATRVFDEFVARDPASAALLLEPWWHFNPADGSVVERPICVNLGGRLFSHYGRRYLDLGADDPRTPSMSEERRIVLDQFDALANSPDLVLDMDFSPGDLQLLNNYTTMHARTAYVDHPEPELRRLLLRLWLVFSNDFELPQEFTDIGIIPRSAALASSP